MNAASIADAMSLILVIVILSIIIGGLIYQVNKKLHKKETAEDITDIIQRSIEDAFRRRDQELSAIHAEERRLADWIKAQLDGEDINLIELASGANTRTVALTLKMAEDEVSLAADSLLKVLQKKAKVEYQLADCTKKHMLNTAAKERDALKSLTIQEAETRAWLAKAEENLKKLQKIIDTSVTELYESKTLEEPPAPLN